MAARPRRHELCAIQINWTFQQPLLLEVVLAVVVEGSRNTTRPSQVILFGKTWLNRLEASTAAAPCGSGFSSTRCPSCQVLYLDSVWKTHVCSLGRPVFGDGRPGVLVQVGRQCTITSGRCKMVSGGPKYREPLSFAIAKLVVRISSRPPQVGLSKANIAAPALAFA